ncbi:DinB family protein [Aequorivita marisscotiae]|uniref:DinB family protein n=1 Tax=Aequorivita marisscotiae TaxID=3040348 RepID=A0ABY8KT88_9FLAO|nr:DinB family protein [Aequorivita sp. Ant34-E75]WGF91375.1 DinB family protein [Aequorivita sp. Ant34-E75]
MNTSFKIWKKNREQLLAYFNNYSLEQLNKIPSGFSNNLIWNIGHVIVVQQALVYKGSGLEGYVSEELFKLYMPGTKPTGNTSQQEVDDLKGLLMLLLEKTEADFRNGKFVTYNERKVGEGFILSSFEDAHQFNNYHEGMHFGYMMNIRKFV